MHLNDSKAPKGSKRDLHANIGTGFLGLRAFHNVMNEERFQGLPMILETPIDRPNPVLANKSQLEEEVQDSEQESDSVKATKQKKTPKKKPSSSSRAPPTIEDKNVWAREIKLLESLIGMDLESSEFRSLEAQLSEVGRAEREKHQEQYERKLEADAKKKKKELEKGQKSLADMFQPKKGTK
jgi:AP endonuclease-1